MRCVSFVDRIKFEFSGNVHKNAVILCDVDNDLCNELVIGSLTGELAVFKGTQTKPWALARNLGMIAAIAVGDVVNCNQNYLVSISVEGCLYIFDLTRPQIKLEERRESDSSKKSSSIVSNCEEATEGLKSVKSKEPLRLRAFHNQKLPANTKIALLADIDSDGQVELIVGLTDRVVRTYRWAKVSETKGKLVGVHKWEFADQIGSVSLNPVNGGEDVNIIVSQPGGTYAKLECWKKNIRQSVLQTTEEVEYDSAASEDENKQATPKCSETVEKISKLTPVYFELDSAKMRNRSISTDVVGGIHGKNSAGEETNSLLALGTIDGTLMLVNENEVLWSLQVDHQLFALSKLDIIDDEKEELIACAWDGQTYIVNQDRDSVRFQFEDYVSAFVAGHYTLKPESEKANVSCLVYVTFNSTIYLYYNVKLSSIKPLTLLDKLPEETVADAKELIRLLDLDDGSGKYNVSNLVSDLLYKYPCLNNQCKNDEAC